MIAAKFLYPGDPETTAELMFGTEFKAVYRSGPVYTTITTDTETVRIPVTEVVCDRCNALIGDYDPCLLIGHSWLYCWDCAKDKLKYVHD